MLQFNFVYAVFVSNFLMDFFHNEKTQKILVYKCNKLPNQELHLGFKCQCFCTAETVRLTIPTGRMDGLLLP